VIQVGFIEPKTSNVWIFDQQIKNTKGITELWKSSDLSDVFVCHLDVDSSFPWVVLDSKG